MLRSAAQASKSLKRVVLTNYATADMRLRCKALGADKVFDKSSELEDLITYCDSLAECKASRDGDAGKASPLAD